MQSNPNPLQWGRAAACTTFELGSMKQSSPSPWTCTKGHALWPVFLMPDERYTGGWACDVCDRLLHSQFLYHIDTFHFFCSHLQFFCSAPVLHCEICKFDVCGQCQVNDTTNFVDVSQLIPFADEALSYASARSCRCSERGWLG